MDSVLYRGGSFWTQLFARNDHRGTRSASLEFQIVIISGVFQWRAASEPLWQSVEWSERDLEVRIKYDYCVLWLI